VVQWNSGAVVQIRWIMGLAISPSLQSLAFQKGTETRPVVYALSLRTGAGEDPPEHRLLGHWQYLVDHVEARLDNRSHSIVVLNDDHVADEQIFCGNLPFVALVELFKVLVLP